MVLWLSLRWWYGAGVGWIFDSAIVRRQKAWFAYFSTGSLLMTLFAPYKQTFVGGSGSSIDAKFKAEIDRFVSRFVGFFVRFFLILAWLVCSLLSLITGLAAVAAWPVVPVLPLVSLILMAVGN